MMIVNKQPLASLFNAFYLHIAVRLPFDYAQGPVGEPAEPHAEAAANHTMNATPYVTRQAHGRGTTDSGCAATNAGCFDAGIL
jgi:hypothetical protein